MKNLSILAKSLDKIGLQVYTVYIRAHRQAAVPIDVFWIKPPNFSGDGGFFCLPYFLRKKFAISRIREIIAVNIVTKINMSEYVTILPSPLSLKRGTTDNLWCAASIISFHEKLVNI